MAHALVTLAAAMVAVGVLVAAATVVVMAWSLLRPPRMTDVKALWVLRRLSPGDLGLRFEDVSFTVRDPRDGRPLRLAAWWIPAGRAAEEGKCVVLLHGYADAKVGAIAWAPGWHALGFHVLALDLRAHGESGGAHCTGGFFERHDVEQVIGQLRSQRPAQTRAVVLFGASMGAAVAAGAAALRDDVAAIVMESPYADFRAAATAHMDLLGLPGGAFPAAALKLAEAWSGARFDDVRTADLVRQLRCAVMVITPAGDPFLEPSQLAAIEAAAAARPRGARRFVLWRVEGASHLMAVNAGPELYQLKLEQFLGGALPPAPSSQTSEADYRALVSGTIAPEGCNETKSAP